MVQSKRSYSESISSEEDQFESRENPISSTFNDNFKTHYFAIPKTSSTNSERGFPQTFCAITGQQSEVKPTKTPFLSLFNGKEPLKNVKFRYKLYEKIWKNQSKKIQSIVNNANDDLFRELICFINEPLPLHQMPSSPSLQPEKLSIGYIQMTSNTANNLRILDQFYKYIEEKNSQRSFLITLNTKNCPHIKGALKEIIKQFDEGHGNKLDSSKYLFYDLGILASWFEKNGLDERIVIVIEDTNLFNNQLLNQVIKSLQSTSSQIPFKLLITLSCDTVSSWINNNIRSDIRLNSQGYKFRSNDNISLGFMILHNLFLTPELTEENPLLISNTLSTIILTRFQNSNNSIDALISEVRLCYMIHFYQSPLSILITRLDESKLYVDGLRKLPSFKKLVEKKLAVKSMEGKDLLSNDACVIKLFQSAKAQYQTHKLVIMNANNVIYQLDPKKRKEKFELYTSLVNGKLFTSKYFRECLNITQHPPRVVERITSSLTTNCLETLNGVSDVYLIKLNKGLNAATDTPELVELLETYFQNPVLTTPLKEMPFNEIFSMDGGVIHEKFEKPPLFEENFENLMIDLLRPNLRATIETSLENAETYLGQIEKPPIICQMFKVYKEAPAAINLHDFYQAYSASLERPKSMTDEDWHKTTYSWFLQNCFEMMHLGIVQPKKSSEYLEKAIWKGV
ncbi:ORC3 [Candida oxycetoniae]|uniref:ORC3 n=1 Tax=Candida oxycetoniae TaxID=497107 RepID=A0AAI9WYG4_9ASCO|nr:ORC3 [Candida oxycetoniae]KAI3405271.2 ORC3 [Candida oxycetoniae]